MGNPKPNQNAKSKKDMTLPFVELVVIMKHACLSFMGGLFLFFYFFIFFFFFGSMKIRSRVSLGTSTYVHAYIYGRTWAIRVFSMIKRLILLVLILDQR